LSALLENTSGDAAEGEVAAVHTAGTISMVPVQMIESNPYQPRQHFNETELHELALSISEHGIIQPLTLRKIDQNKFQLIAGERRLKAAQLAGLTEVPAYVRLANDEQMLEIALVENIQRSDLNPLEIALSFQRLLEECRISQEELSQKVGKDRSTVSNYIRLLKLPTEIQVAVRDNLITMGHARAIINVEDEKSQLEILQRILESKLSVRDVEETVRQSGRKKEIKSPDQPPALPRKFEIARETLQDRLQASINLKVNRKGAGSIIIPFHSSADFDRIIAKLES